MSIKKNRKAGRSGGIEGMLGGLSDLVEKLGELAEKGEQLSKAGEINLGEKSKDLKGVFGYSVKVGLGKEGVRVEPFGNIRQDEVSGKPIVEEVREPVVDVFEEDDHTLVVAELPGIGVDDIRLEVKDNNLTIYAEQGEKKYSKEVELPMNYPKDKMQVSCNNGILEIKCMS